MQLVQLLQEFQDTFAWSYADMRGLDRTVVHHKIVLKQDAKPIQQHQYRMNPNYAARVKEEIAKLLQVGFITPIVIVPKKNKKLRVCVDYRRKLNACTIADPFPIPYIDALLDDVAAGNESYSFLDMFLGHNQIRMAPEDKEKTAYITDWCAFVSKATTFGLFSADATLQRVWLYTSSGLI